LWSPPCCLQKPFVYGVVAARCEWESYEHSSN
jgi:hypothetical protein